jgi:hypothetical protein
MWFNITVVCWLIVFAMRCWSKPSTKIHNLLTWGLLIETICVVATGLAERLAQ